MRKSDTSDTKKALSYISSKNKQIKLTFSFWEKYASVANKKSHKLAWGDHGSRFIQTGNTNNP